MKIIIRLVGYSEIIDGDKYVYEYKCNVNTIFNFDILKLIFNKYKHIISENELNNCTLTCNSKNLKKDCLLDNNTILEQEILYRVFIFTANTEIKNKLINIFTNNGYKVSLHIHNEEFADDLKDEPTKNSTNILDNNSTNSTDILDNDEIFNDAINVLKNIEDKVKEANEEQDKVKEPTEQEKAEYEEKILNALKKLDSDDDSDEESDDDVIHDIKQNLELFKDDDFLTLIRIYKNRGHLFNDFYKYINSSEIIKININKEEKEEIDYNENLNFIKELNLNFQEDKILEALQKTNNHINLAIRYLLYNS